MKEMKKILAFFLCFVMVLGFVPASAFAARADEVEAASETQTNTALYNALAEAKSFIDALTINNSSNDPKTVVSTWKTEFSWDNEKRESAKKDYLFEWSYYNGVVFEGLDYVAEVTGETVYSDYVAEYLAAMIPSTTSTTWSKTTNDTSKDAAGYVSTHGVDCYKTASLLLDYGYNAMAAELYGHLQGHQANYTDSDKGGNYWHSWTNGSRPTYTVWLDGLYMVQPFMAEYAASHNDTAELDRIAARFAWIGENMYNQGTGLYYHMANSSDSYNNYNNQYWGRAIGWYAAAMVDVMDDMSGTNLDNMKTQFKTLVDGMLRYQDSTTGMWRQFVNVSSSSIETSVTSLMTYAIMKAVNHGWLDISYAQYALKAFVGMANNALDASGLHYICFKGSTNSYTAVSKDTYVNEGKGVGPFIMAYAEMLEYGMKLDHITITAPTKTEYEVGDELDLTGLTVTGYNRLGQEIPVTGGYTVSAVDMTTAGTKTVTVTYYDCTASFEITVKEAPTTEPTEPETSEPVEAEIEYILVEGTTAYAVGDELTFSMLKAFCDDGSTIDLLDENGYPVDGVEIEGTCDMNTAGMYSVTATYEGVTSNTYHFTVSAPETLAGNESVSISGSSAGITDVTIAENKDIDLESMKNALGFADHVAYDLSGVFKTPGFKATVTLTVPEEWRDGNVAVYHVDGDTYTKYADVDSDPATYTFITNHFSTWVQTYNARAVSSTNYGEGTLVGGTNYVLDTDGVIDPGIPYLIVSANSGNASAFRNDEGSRAGQNVSISSGAIASGFNNESTSTWTFTASGNMWYIANGTQQLRLSNSDILSSTGQALTVTHQGNGEYQITNGSRYLSCVTYDYGGQTIYSWSRGSSGDEYSVYLFKQVTSSGEAVTFTVNPANATIAPNGTATLAGTVTVADETVDLSDCTIIWASDDDDTATVSNGTVTGVADGSANITATLSAVNGIALQQNIVLTVPIEVSTKTITKVVMDQTSGTVERASDPRITATGSTITVTYDNGEEETIPVTLDMVKGDYDVNSDDTYTGLTVVYGGVEAEGNYTLIVTPTPGNNYPEYPKEGSVTVDKRADSTYLQETGVVKVELTTSGIPVKTGVDAVLVIDISNSMAWETGGTVDNFEKNKLLDVLAAIDSFAEIFLADNEDGSPTTNTITIVTFAGKDTEYWGGSSNSQMDSVITMCSRISDLDTIKWLTANTEFTGRDSSNEYLLKLAYLDANGTRQTTTGQNRGDTNYDYAFYQTQQAVKAIMSANGEESKREIHVLFMTDGCATNFNGTYYNGPNAGNYHKPGTTTDYENNGAFKTLGGAAWVEWIKESISDNMGNIYARDVYSKVDGMYAIGFDMAHGSFSGIGNWTGVDGTTDFNEIVSKIVTDEFGNGLIDVTPATSKEELNEFYTSLANEIRFAATSAYFVDQMGDSVSIQMASTVYKREQGGSLVHTPLETLPGGIVPQIQVLNYNIYKATDVGKTIGGVEVTEAMVGQRYGNPIVIETVTFTDDGAGNVTGAYSNLVTGNILQGGVIYAKNFWYNTNSYAVMIDTDGNRVAETSLPGETFRWNIGIINDVQWAMTYYVYLEGSMEGDAEAGSYRTNNYATLYYKNWLGNNAQLDTTSPQVGWKSANIRYAFYLVDQSGNPIVNQTTGQTGSFYNAVKVTQPVVYKEILLNNLKDVDTLEASSLSTIPAGYKLYDPSAAYKVVILSETGEGSWTITYNMGPGADGTYGTEDDVVLTGENAKVQSSYVTGFSGDAASRQPLVTSKYTDTVPESAGYVVAGDYDYTHTTIWFAVLWIPETIPDTVVIDYGLPVDIGVLVNDQFGENGTLNGLGTIAQKDEALATAEGESIYTSSPSVLFTTDPLTLNYGTAKINGSEVRYTPSSMIMDSYDKFAYEVEYKFYKDGYDATGNPIGTATMQYYYGEVTVIPATTIYYEDTFLNFGGTATWTQSAASDSTQAEDRPGEYSLPSIDANNVYGYDGAYSNMSTHSLGNAAHVHVDANSYGTATFSFYGTGFDVISMTSNTTGTLAVQVKQGDTLVRSTLVDTYYGYAKNADGEWEISPNTPNSIYQVPVIKVSDLPYGQYTVTITATYAAFFDHTSAGSYDLYLDAIRIYDPTGNQNDVANDAYVKDGEGWPIYEELRNNVIDASNFEANKDATLNGAIFIDSNDANTSVADYVSYGPNNELYLAPGQAVAFNLNLPDNVAAVQIGLKVANGVVVNYQIHNAGTNGAVLNVVNGTLQTTTDMYYSIYNERNGTIVITNTNTGSGILSITNIKVTFKENPNATKLTDLFNIDGKSATNAVRSMSYVQPVLPGFEPEKIDITFSRTTAQIGNNVIVTITTSDDVKDLLINNQIATNKTTSYVTGETVWTYTVPVVENGTLNVSVIGYDSAGQYTVPFTESVTVINMSGTQEDLLGKLFG